MNEFDTLQLIKLTLIQTTITNTTGGTNNTITTTGGTNNVTSTASSATSTTSTASTINSSAITSNTTGASNSNAITSNTTGASNSNAITSNTTGASNSNAITSNTTGASNSNAITSNTTGASNSNAITSNTTGASNSNAKLLKIKELFKKRHFQELFNDKNLLVTYVLEYIGTRALCYRTIFNSHLFNHFNSHLFNHFNHDERQSNKSCTESADINAHHYLTDTKTNSCDMKTNSCDMKTNSCDTKTNSCDTKTSSCDTKVNVKSKTLRNPFQITCLGAGNGSELIAIFNVLSTQFYEKVDIVIHDLNLYDNVLDLLFTSNLEMIQRLRNLNGPINLEKITCDLLDKDQIKSSGLIDAIAKTDILTANFLLNEILTASKTAFVYLITTIVASLKPGALFLIVDPASDFSQVTLCKSSQSANTKSNTNQNDSHSKSSSTIMLFQLLDAIKAFEKISSLDSCWYRFPPELQKQYPIKLHNMRYFMRIYRKI